MVDDVGTKVPRETVACLPPSMIVLTSPGNEQHWWLLDPPVTDYDLFSRLLNAFVQQKLRGVDPGMAGANRIGRLPDGVNGKRQYRHAETGEPFRCRVLAFNPDARFTIEALIGAFDLTLAAPRAAHGSSSVNEEQAAARRQEFDELRRDCEAIGIMRKRHANHAGRIPIVCPWYALHTNASKSGTYLVEPNEHNNWRGSFVCYHSSTHANDCHLRDLRTWADQVITSAAAAAAQRANNKPFDLDACVECRAPSAMASASSAKS
jgi:hypothetical protein